MKFLSHESPGIVFFKCSDEGVVGCAFVLYVEVDNPQDKIDQAKYIVGTHYLGNNAGLLVKIPVKDVLEIKHFKEDTEQKDNHDKQNINSNTVR